MHDKDIKYALEALQLQTLGSCFLQAHFTFVSQNEVRYVLLLLIAAVPSLQATLSQFQILMQVRVEYKKARAYCHEHSCCVRKAIKAQGLTLVKRTEVKSGSSGEEGSASQMDG